MDINSQKVLYNKVSGDENMTPKYGVTPIIKYISKDSVIWCPFDLDSSEYVIELKKAGFKVINTHIATGQDFFEYEPEEHWDIIVSNPPFKKKRLFFERALSFNKPFALLMTLTIFNDKYPCWSFKELDKQVQLLKFDKRIEYMGEDGLTKKKITFQSGYICSDLLPKDFIMEELIR